MVLSIEWPEDLQHSPPRQGQCWMTTLDAGQYTPCMQDPITRRKRPCTSPTPENPPPAEATPEQAPHCMLRFFARGPVAAHHTCCEAVTKDPLVPPLALWALGAPGRFRWRQMPSCPADLPARRATSGFLGAPIVPGELFCRPHPACGSYAGSVWMMAWASVPPTCMLTLPLSGWIFAHAEPLLYEYTQRRGV